MRPTNVERETPALVSTSIPEIDFDVLLDSTLER